MSAASLKAASSTAVKSKCSPGERCAGPGARITFVLRSRALASRLTNTTVPYNARYLLALQLNTAV